MDSIGCGSIGMSEECHEFSDASSLRGSIAAHDASQTTIMVYPNA
jgi:hypothetical protein